LLVLKQSRNQPLAFLAQNIDNFQEICELSGDHIDSKPFLADQSSFGVKFFQL